MAYPLLGWRNHVASGALSAGASVVGLGVAQLRADDGNAAAAWQTPAGVGTPEAGAFVLLEQPAPVPWRVFLAARTNLTPAARWRIRVGAPAGLVEAQPSLDLDFAPVAWSPPPGWNFTRADTVGSTAATTATRINALG